jgi:nucleoside-diphosphate-sugar epimerase
MKTALVTGATGFVGRQAVRALLDRGYTVHALSRRAAADDSCRWHAVDLFDGDAVARVVEQVRPSHLLHLAWVTEHGRYWTSPENLRWVEATLRLCRQFHEAGGRRLVGAGTCAEYAWDDATLGERPVDEWRTPRRPAHFYGMAKNATFELLTAYQEATALGFAWARLFFPYGPDRRPTLIPEIVRALREGRPALCSHGRQQRDFIHVRDAGAALAALLDSDVRGPVNIGTGTATPIAEVARRLGVLLRRPDLIHLGAIEARPNEPGFLVADISRLRNEVGFVPKVTLVEGLQDTIAASGPEAPQGRHP